ncbi:MAG: hypothetical protein QM784_10720 [Polyangiaceae bacterium]
MGVRSGCFVSLFILLSTSTALAEPTNSGPIKFDLESPLGWTQGRHSGGVTFGVSGRARYEIFAAGVSLQAATIVLGSMGSASAIAGLSIPLDFVRVDMLAELGLNSYGQVGANFLTEDPGTSATLPFAGVRPALLFRVLHSNRDVDVWVGPSVHYAKDFHSVRRTYTYYDDSPSWFGVASEGHWDTRSVRIGQSRLCYLLTVGVTLSP